MKKSVLAVVVALPSYMLKVKNYCHVEAALRYQSFCDHSRHFAFPTVITETWIVISVNQPLRCLLIHQEPH
jgi:hypothetical protein